MTQPCNDDFSDLPDGSWGEDSASVAPDRIKMLVVDDSAMMRRILLRALTDLGFTKVFAAEDGAAGLVLAEREVPDIIISDYHMPGMHGLEFVETVRRNEALDQTAIVMLSSADDQGVVERARDLGADTFMVKPFETADLRQLIDDLYQRFNCAQIAWPE